MKNKKKSHYQKISPLAILMLLATIIIFLFALFEPGKTNNEELAIKNIQEENITTSIEVSNDTSRGNDQETTSSENKGSSLSPLRNSSRRITKKPFGIFITPSSSPVQPERFRGFHTGTDFEVFPEEFESTVEVRSICEGEIIEKRIVGGYGGVIVQSCSFDGEPATVLYGHLDLRNAEVEVGEAVSFPQKLAILGADKSPQTDGERKHLHLSIHRGNSTNLRGYVSSRNELEEWINFEELFE